MKKIVIALMLVMCVIVLAGCGNNPKSMFEEKTYFVEYKNGKNSTFLLEFEKDGYVKLIYPQLNNASEIGTYSISEEKYDDKHHIHFNIKELGHKDYLFDEENMSLLAVDSETLEYDPDSYRAERADLNIKEYNN